MNEGIIQEITDGGKQKLYDLAAVIKGSPGLKTKDLAERLDLSERTMARHLKILQALGVVQFLGAPKTGGYVLTNDFLKDIEK
jgi:ATP-dependent DNA helicase RecG